jgi:ubiquinone/menaquinone biosynthesis C-methylase UbiE
MWKYKEDAEGGGLEEKPAGKKSAESKRDTAIWSEFARVYSHEQNGRSEAVAKIVPLLKEHGVKDVIDIGCGRGRNSLFLAREGFNVTGVDISKEALQILQETAKEGNLKIRTIVSDDRKIKVPNAFFDAVVSTLVIELHKRPEREEAISEIERILKPGGILLITGSFSREEITELKTFLKDFKFISPDDERIAEIGKDQEFILEKKK